MLARQTVSRLLALIRANATAAFSVRYDDRCSRRSILERFPPNALSSILRYSPLQGRIAASQTCTVVRDFALNTPCLWTRVHVGSCSLSLYSGGELTRGRAHTWNSLSGALEVLSRGRGAETLTGVFVSFAAPCLKTPSSIIRLQHVLREGTIVKFVPYDSFTMRISSPENGRIIYAERMSSMSDFDWISVAAEIFCSPAPGLQILEISVPRDPWWSRTTGDRRPLVMPEDTLVGECGQLRVCRLSGILLGHTPAFSSLTTFNYQPIPNVLSLLGITEILTQMPTLQTLGLCGRLAFEQASASVAPMPAQTALRHRCLRRIALALATYDAHVADGVLSVIAFLTTVCTRADLAIIVDFQSLGDGPYGFCPAIPSLSSLHFAVPRPLEMELGHRTTLLRGADVTVLANPIVRSSSGLPIPNIGIRLFDLSTLVRMTVGEMHWEELVALSPTLPQLKLLCITLASCSIIGGICECPSVFTSVSSSSSERALDCPALETLRISFEPHNAFGNGNRCYLESLHDADSGDSVTPPYRCAYRNRGSLSLAEIYSLIHGSIRLSAPLRELVLFGVHALIDIDPVPAYLSIRKITEVLLVREEVAYEVQRSNALWSQRQNSLFWAPSDVFDPLHPSTFAAEDEMFDHIGPLPSSSL
ncbi:hypothetical protein EXIGLDRAFT_843312 [Exidia glandulosa HHB12029]|uniref:F-box domain-containing protein n=1 Tax=Exidia glandulosa HHB12029 TaxID=1314781 RepID=A0A165CRP2_EXIGL|nr:hypothetical protein EXIGLDRAFT_843312 [Exidia glandulosa HHB12029]